MATLFRKNRGNLNHWHFHPGCPYWPVREFIEQSEPPSEGNLCLRCVELQGKGAQSEEPTD